jgi:hypothetical protein
MDDLLKEITASQYLIAVYNAGAGPNLRPAREAIENAMAAFEPRVAEAALATILLLRVLHDAQADLEQER